MLGGVSGQKAIVRLITKNDATLVVGLIAGTAVIFQRPFRFLWEIAWDVQERWHVDLLPALTIFAGVFMPWDQLEAVAERALLPETLAAARRAGFVEGDVLCFPMIAAGVAVGVPGLQEGATLGNDQRKALGVVALIERADDGLYQAKRAGTDRFSVAGAVATPVAGSEPPEIALSATGSREP
jgi:hypothetical protein